MDFRRFIINYVVLIGVYLSLSLLVRQPSVTSGFVSLSIVCLIVCWLSGILFFKNERNLQRILVLAFIFKLIIGIIHTLLFFDLEYFSGTGDINRSLQHDFTGYFNYVTYLIEEKSKYGYFHFDSTEHITSHQELLNIIATMMYRFGVYSMNIVPINSLLSNLGAINIVVIINRFYPEYIEKTKDSTKYLLMLMALFPMMLDNAIFIRDIAGQFLMSFAAAIMLLCNNIMQVILLIPASILMSYQRNIYMFAPVVLFAYNRMFYDNINRKKNVVLLFVTIVVTMSAMSYILGELTEHLEAREGSYGTNSSLLTFPIRLFVAIVGPFPWTQIQYAFETPSFGGHIYLYIMGWFHVSCLIAIIMANENRWAWIKHPLSVLGLTLFGFGIINNCTHLSYITAGSYFFVPLIYLYTRESSFMRAKYIALILLLVLNIIVISVGGLGIKSLV